MIVVVSIIKRVQLRYYSTVSKNSHGPVFVVHSCAIFLPQLNFYLWVVYKPFYNYFHFTMSSSKTFFGYLYKHALLWKLLSCSCTPCLRCCICLSPVTETHYLLAGTKDRTVCNQVRGPSRHGQTVATS